MLRAATEFPYPGSWGWMDDVEPVTNLAVVEHVRILDRPDKEGQVGVAIRSRRYPREIASGNRRVPLAALRETEQPISAQPSGRKPKAKGGRRR